MQEDTTENMNRWQDGRMYRDTNIRGMQLDSMPVI